MRIPITDSNDVGKWYKIKDGEHGLDCNQKRIKMLNKMRRPDSRQAEKPSGQCHFYFIKSVSRRQRTK